MSRPIIPGTARSCSSRRSISRRSSRSACGFPAGVRGRPWRSTASTSPHPTAERGYLVLGREWKGGDVVELNLPMPVQRVAANPHVKADTGLLAIQRGPLVYCLEACDRTSRSQALSCRIGGIQSREGEATCSGGVVVVKGSPRRSRSQDWTQHAVSGSSPSRLRCRSRRYRTTPGTTASRAR